MYKTLFGNLLTLVSSIIGKLIKRLYNNLDYLIGQKYKVNISSLFIVIIVQNYTKQVFFALKKKKKIQIKKKIKVTNFQSSLKQSKTIKLLRFKALKNSCSVKC